VGRSDPHPLGGCGVSGLRMIDACYGELEGAGDVDRCLDLMMEGSQALGFSALAYDYAPVPLSPDGRMIQPSVMRTRNLPSNFSDLWLREGFFRIDPAQQLCSRQNVPFAWSHAPGSESLGALALTQEHAPVLAYLHDFGLTCGITVPIYGAGGGLATVTAIRERPDRGFPRHAQSALAQFSLLAHYAHAAIFDLLDVDLKTTPAVKLTRRELECMRWVARGKTAEDTAVILDLSLATVCFHLRNATQKLQATNRGQAIAHASHYRLIDLRN